MTFLDRKREPKYPITSSRWRWTLRLTGPQGPIFHVSISTHTNPVSWSSPRNAMTDQTWLGVPPPLVEDLMNCSHTITDIKADLSDHERAMTAEAHIPMMPLRPKPLSDECSCSPTCSTSGATRLNTMPQEANEASRRYNKGEHLGASRRHTCSCIHEMLSDKPLILT